MFSLLAFPKAIPPVLPWQYRQPATALAVLVPEPLWWLSPVPEGTIALIALLSADLVSAPEWQA